MLLSVVSISASLSPVTNDAIPSALTNLTHQGLTSTYASITGWTAEAEPPFWASGVYCRYGKSAFKLTDNLIRCVVSSSTERRPASEANGVSPGLCAAFFAFLVSRNGVTKGQKLEYIKQWVLLSLTITSIFIAPHHLWLLASFKSHPDGKIIRPPTLAPNILIIFKHGW